MKVNYMYLGKYITVCEESTKGKTFKYHLWNRVNQSIKLGEVKWNTSWRKYCFYPEGETVFDNQCLNTIVEFLDSLNDSKNKEVPDEV